MAVQAPAHLQPVFRFSADQAQETFDVISRFGSFWLVLGVGIAVRVYARGQRA